LARGPPRAKSTLAISCVNTQPAGVNKFTFKLDANVTSATELRSVVLTASGPDDPTEIGHSSQELANPNFKPTKFKDTNQFNFALQDKDGKDFAPLDQCEFQLLLPKNVTTLKSGNSFDGRFMFHCDQNGGSIAFPCSVK
jgi:hypothetical protein